MPDASKEERAAQAVFEAVTRFASIAGQSSLASAQALVIFLLVRQLRRLAPAATARLLQALVREIEEVAIDDGRRSPAFDAARLDLISAERTQ